VPDQWELYRLTSDPTERANLVIHDIAEPKSWRPSACPST
jgi:hypothetical protein